MDWMACMDGSKSRKLRAQQSAIQRGATHSIGCLAAAPQHGQRLERFQNEWKHANRLQPALIGCDRSTRQQRNPTACLLSESPSECSR